jgi:hypothetical protein
MARATMQRGQIVAHHMTRHPQSADMGPITFAHIVRSQLSRHPLAQIEDLYKLAHQAALGSEHAVTDNQSARDWLLRELAALAGDPVEPLLEAISPKGRILRVHLRPFAATRGDPETLLQAFVRTANEYRGSLRQLKRYWASIVELSTRGEIPFHPDDLRWFIDRMETAGFPAIHHSAQYRAAYQPTYRVVASEFLPSGWLDEPPPIS